MTQLLFLSLSVSAFTFQLSDDKSNSFSTSVGLFISSTLCGICSHASFFHLTTGENFKRRLRHFTPAEKQTLKRTVLN